LWTYPPPQKYSSFPGPVVPHFVDIPSSPDILLLSRTFCPCAPGHISIHSHTHPIKDFKSLCLWTFSLFRHTHSIQDFLSLWSWTYSPLQTNSSYLGPVIPLLLDISPSKDVLILFRTHSLSASGHILLPDILILSKTFGPSAFGHIPLLRLTHPVQDLKSLCFWRYLTPQTYLSCPDPIVHLL